MLHITNGDAAASGLEAAEFKPVLSWRDILHEGPVPAGLSLQQMSDVRAQFLADGDSTELQNIRQEFAARDKAFLSATELVLWFEHDLYDQLQLIQILSAAPEVPIDLICTDEYLGPATPRRIAELWPDRRRVTQEHRNLAGRAWDAFTAPTPDALRDLVEDDTSLLPFLKAALLRHLEEFPSERNGLGRNEHQILSAINNGARTFPELFRATQAMEEAVYLGDSSLEFYLDRLLGGRTPLITSQPYSLTNAGAAVLSGQADNRSLNGIDRWIGGTHVVIE